MAKQAKNTVCLWYDGGAEDAARFYAETFPDSSVGAVHRAPADYPSGKKGDVLTVQFTVLGIGCLGLNGREQAELRDETLVVGREFAADARRKRVANQLILKQPGRLAPPAVALGEPRKGAARHQQSGGLGDDMVVR